MWFLHLIGFVVGCDRMVIKRRTSAYIISVLSVFDHKHNSTELGSILDAYHKHNRTELGSSLDTYHKHNSTELGSYLYTYLKCTGFQTDTYHWPMISAVSS
jgi:hypothetical protein